jgi:AcrR family transcriptional regulator
MPKRPYTLRKRAERRDETRERIAAAAAALHEELGPRNTTISAVAERAGVQRLTVYRHFPDERALFAACTGHWLERHPLPDPAMWSGLQDRPARVRAALQALYTYYRGTRRMWQPAYRDMDEVAALKAPMRAVQRYLDSVRDGLLEGGPSAARSSRRTRGVLSHVLQFATWQSLAREGFGDGEMADMATEWVAAELS